MDIQRLQQLLQDLEQTGGTVCKVICEDPSMVEQMENLFGLGLPESVKSFYEMYEYLQVGTYEFVWIKVFPDLIKRIREQGNVPHNYLPILPDGMGGYYYVACAEKNKPRPEEFGFVVHHFGGAQDVFEFCNSDFLGFVASRVEKELREVGFH